jgi:hypothetical protein
MRARGDDHGGDQRANALRSSRAEVAGHLPPSVPSLGWRPAIPLTVRPRRTGPGPHACSSPHSRWARASLACFGATRPRRASRRPRAKKRRGPGRCHDCLVGLEGLPLQVRHDCLVGLEGLFLRVRSFWARASGSEFGLPALETKSPPIRHNPSNCVRWATVDGPIRGIVISTSILVESCDQPVNVTVVASGTAEYWRRNRHRIRRLRGLFALAIWDPDVRNIRIGVVDPAAGVQPLPSLRETLDTSGVRLKRIASNGRATAVTGDVLNWRQTWKSIALNFQANWLYPRSVGTCFLRLPALTGAAPNKATTDAAHRVSRSVESWATLAG